MAERIQFHLDESVTLGIVRPLRDRGIDITAPADAGLLRGSDEEHLLYATEGARVVVTHDNDFLALHSNTSKLNVTRNQYSAPNSFVAPVARMSDGKRGALGGWEGLLLPSRRRPSQGASGLHFPRLSSLR